MEKLRISVNQLYVIKDGNRVEKNKEIPSRRGSVMIRKYQGSTGITLIKGPLTMLVGTGLPQDKDQLLNGLSDAGVPPEAVQYVVCPYGHVETTGNLNLFPKATLIVGYSVMKGDTHILHNFLNDIPYELGENLEIVATPGLYPQVVSVIARNTDRGTVVIAGGVFHNEGDLDEPDLWADESQDADLQQQSRITLLKEADYIVPRYSPIYRVPECYKGSDLNFVVTP